MEHSKYTITSLLEIRRTTANSFSVNQQHTEERMEQIQLQQDERMASVIRQSRALLSRDSKRVNQTLQRLGLWSQDRPVAPGPPTGPRSSGILRHAGLHVPTCRIPSLKTRGEEKMVCGRKLLTATQQCKDLLELVHRLPSGCLRCGQPSVQNQPVTGEILVPIPPKTLNPRTHVPRAPTCKAPEAAAPQAPAEAPREVYEALVPTPPKGPPPRAHARQATTRRNFRGQTSVPQDSGSWAPPPQAPVESYEAPVEVREPLRFPCRRSPTGPEKVAKRADDIQNLLSISSERVPDPRASFTKVMEDLDTTDDWEVKRKTLLVLQNLIVGYSAETVLTRLRDVSLVLMREMTNLRSCIACAAIDCMALLYLKLRHRMDTEVFITLPALLLRLGQGKEVFIKNKVNVALNCLVQNSKYKTVVTALLSSGGHRHKSSLVRTSTAEQLGHLVDLVGADGLFATMKRSTENLVITVSKMAMDTSAQVRHEGLRILKTFVHLPEFTDIWEKFIPIETRRTLDKMLH